MKKDDFGNRMKEYENVSRYYLTRRLPVIVRIDGRSFHTFTKGFKKPFDDILMQAMQKTAKYLCENIMGCKLAYTQSDEISLLLIDYDTIDSDAWFKNNLQKIASVSASIATMAFNFYFNDLATQNIINWYKDASAEDTCETPYYEKKNKMDNNLRIMPKMATFDSRAFVLPKEEVCNYFIWRQKDCTRNSIQLVAHANFTYSEMQKKSCNQLQDMLFTQKNINWNDFSTSCKRGTCVVREPLIEERGKWIIDNEIPIFSTNRNYIEKYVFVGE